MPWRERLYLACFYPLDSFRIKIYQLILFLFCVFVVTGGFAFHAANASELTTSEKGQITAEPLTFSLETQLLNNPILRQSAARSCRAIFVLGQRKAEKKLDLSASLSGERQIASNFKTSNSDPVPSSLRGYNHAYDDIYDLELTARYRLYDWGVGSARIRSNEFSLQAERLSYQSSLSSVVEDILRVMMQIESALQEVSYRTTALQDIAPHVEAIEA